MIDLSKLIFFMLWVGLGALIANSLHNKALKLGKVSGYQDAALYVQEERLKGTDTKTICEGVVDNALAKYNEYRGIK